MTDLATQRLLLDTHVWFWVLTGNRQRLSAASVRWLEQEAKRARLLVSVISVWELCLLEAKGRVGLALPIDAWLEQALARPEFEIAGINPRIALDSTRLPGGFQADPADRFLVATARSRRACLVTQDEQILSYAAAGHLVARAA
jgi:PIN domain nuclease of toxin-antitoxin system